MISDLNLHQFSQIKFEVAAAFFCIGLDVGLVGSSLPELQVAANASLPGVTGLVSASAFGALLGIGSQTLLLLSRSMNGPLQG